MVANPELPSATLPPLTGKTVLVTGHSGFIGSWLCVFLTAVGSRAVGYSLSDDPVSESRARWLEGLGVTDIRGDVRTLDNLLVAADRHSPDLLIHLAAQPILGRGYVEPHLTFETNINGSLSTLEALRLGAVGSLLHVTSDKCYAPMNPRGPALTETSPLGGEGPYPASKSIAEAIFKEYGTLVPAESALATVRLGNVIGGGDEADRLVPNALRSFHATRPFSLRDPDAVRPFQHVLDVAAGLSQLASELVCGRIDEPTPLNFAPPDSGSSALDLVAALARSWGDGATLDPAPSTGGPPIPEQQVIRLDGGRASELLNWKHALDLSESAAWTVAWAKSTWSGASPADATFSQVADFLGMGADVRA